MNQTQIERDIEALGNTDKENLIESICLVDFWRRISESEDQELIISVHKQIGKHLVTVVDYWHKQSNPIWDSFMAEGLFPMENPNKQVGDIVKYGNNVGIVKRIEHHKNHKLYIVHTTDGNEMPFIARL